MSESIELPPAPKRHVVPLIEIERVKCRLGKFAPPDIGRKFLGLAELGKVELPLLSQELHTGQDHYSDDLMNRLTGFLKDADRY